MTALRYLYERPKSQRTCPGCLKVIKRNIALHEGETWHYGCLLKAATYKYRCLQCGSRLRGLDTSTVYILDQPERSCRFCGSTGLQPLYGPPLITIAGTTITREVLT